MHYLVALFAMTAAAYHILPYSLALLYVFFHHASNSRGQWAQLPLPRPRPIRRAYKPNNVHNVSLSPTSKVETTYPRNFSECVQKSITSSLYHNILRLSIVRSTFCIHLVFSENGCTYPRYACHSALITRSFYYTAAALHRWIFSASRSKKVRGSPGNSGHYETRLLYCLGANLILLMAVWQT